MASVMDSVGGTRVTTLEVIQSILKHKASGGTTLDVANELYGTEEKASYVANTARKVIKEHPKFRDVLNIEHPVKRGAKSQLSDNKLDAIVTAFMASQNGNGQK